MYPDANHEHIDDGNGRSYMLAWIMSRLAT